ncbi:GMC oxidoreductase [Pendulispora albinea]|uniref:Cholesterol oxidase n=1 Tax=Pendulispora albinea TaxID=2741071 RepID=A0ABZ2LTT3_9BACT
MSDGYDYDYAIIGSGFGGSVSALRLSEKGYRVAVIEMGKRWRAEDFPKSTWDVRKYFWNPALGLHGIFQMTLLRDIFFVHGAGVGGGSLVYANTLLRPPPAAFADPRWVGFDWEKALAPYYDLAKRMLGAVESPFIVETDRILKEVADEMGRGDTFHKHTVGVYFGRAGVKVPDPFFGGEGPERAGCTSCGGCMVGCRYEAKNTLDKNYLYLAEKRGAEVIAESKVIDIRPRPAGGYELTLERSMGLSRPRRTMRVKGVVVSAGSFGTVELLMGCKERGSLPDISPQLGNFVRTNSEALLAVRSRRNDVDYSRGIAITSGAFVDDKTHIEIVRYPAGSDSMSLLTTLLTGGGGSIPRWLRWLGNMVRHPLQFLRVHVPFGWAKRTAILLVMQPVDNYLRYRMRRRWFWPFSRKLDTAIEGGKAVPVYIPMANRVAQQMAKKMDGIGQSGLLEVLFNKASTAHILGGCPIGLTPDDGAVDPKSRLFGYEDIYVVDGSIVPANLGVNPSLTITAMAEHAMSHVPPKPGAVQKPVRLPELAAVNAGAGADD